MTIAKTYAELTGWPAQILAIVTLTAIGGGLLLVAWRSGGRPPGRRPLVWFGACVLCLVLAFTLQSDAVPLFFLLAVVLWVCAFVSVLRLVRAHRGTAT